MTTAQPGSAPNPAWWPYIVISSVSAYAEPQALLDAEPGPDDGRDFTEESPLADAGLGSRPIEAVVADLLDWDQRRPREPLRAGMPREREAELLRKFRAAGPPPGP